jgi:hypothetical protein
MNKRPANRIVFQTNVHRAKSGFRGVIFRFGKYRAIAGCKNRVYLGKFDDIKDAINARLKWEEDQRRIHNLSQVVKNG